MQTITDQCEDCGQVGGSMEFVQVDHADGGYVMLPRCVDRAGCDRRRAAERDVLLAQIAEEVTSAARNVAVARQGVRDAEAELADAVRGALSEGLGATAVARAAGLSRERVYQLRDGRR